MEVMLLNIVVLIFEVIYYSLFMKFTRKEGKFYKYVILFSLITIIFSFVGTNSLINYLLLILMILCGIKHIINIKISLCDMLWLIIMMLIKLIVELLLSIPLYCVINNIYVASIITGVLKCLFIFTFRYKISELCHKLKLLWNANNFYVRYIFSALTFIYTIVSILFLIIKFI